MLILSRHKWKENSQAYLFIISLNMCHFLWIFTDCSRNRNDRDGVLLEREIICNNDETERKECHRKNVI